MIFIDNFEWPCAWNGSYDFAEVIKRSDFNLFLMKRCVLHTLIIIFFRLFLIEKSSKLY